MCDCFHVVLPTWPGAPGSVSGRQLQQQEPEAETEDDYSVTEGPAGEVIRPRPQGSSPVYEYTAEGAGFGGQESSQGRHSSSGRRRSWWRRDSGESTAFASMSHPGSVQESTEVTLKTDVESGASGYSVTGGGDQGIFVKQVLKDSSAAKLFNLREGDQLLSATIFFDHMKYEDALKILQYSEPYKVQFKIKRKLSANKGEEGAVQHSQQGLKGKEKQDIADGCMETPTRTLDEAGDRERLISKSRGDRHRRPQDRFSWPKFQALRSKRIAGPRRSHSSSEASEHRDTRDLSPTSTDTELQVTTDRQEQNSGAGRRRRRFLNLRFGMTSGQGPVTIEQKGSEPQDRKEQAGVLGECTLKEEEKKDTVGDDEAQKKDKTQKTGSMSITTRQMTMRDNYYSLENEEAGKMEFKTERHQRKKKQMKKEERDKNLVQLTKETPPEQQWEDSWEEVQNLEIGIARLSLKDTSEQNLETESQGADAKKDKDVATKDSKFKMPKFKMPSFSVSSPGKHTMEASLEVGAPKVERDVVLHSVQSDLKTSDLSIQLPSADLELRAGHVGEKMPEGELPETEMPTQAAAGAGLKGHLPKVQMSSLKMPKVDLKGPPMDVKDPKVNLKGASVEVSASELEVSLPGMDVDIQAPGAKLEGDVVLDDKDMATKDSKFKMPKLKMPSFGVSVPGKPTMEASLEVGVPKVEGDVTLHSVQGDLKTPDLGIQLPSAELQLRAGQVDMKMPEGQRPEAEMPAQAAAGAGLKGHLPKVQMPSLKMPKVDLKGPQMDVKGPKVDEKGARAKVTTTEPEVSLPSVEVDIQVPGAKLEGDVALADKDVATKDSKFKMPKFKMPSFGMSAPGKPTMEASLEVGAPKVEGDMALPSVKGDLKTPDLSIQLPSPDMELRAGKVGVKMPEGQPPEAEMPAQAAAGAGLKGHLPKVQMPSLKMPKVELKGPNVDVKGPKVDLKGVRGKVSGPDLEVSLTGVEVDIEAPGAKMEGDVALADKDVADKDSKFKMPKFKMPSFSMSAPGKPTVEASLEVGVPKVEADVALPSVKGDLKTPDLSIQLPSAELELRAGHVDMKLQEDQTPEAEMPSQAAARAGLKGHLPKVQMPSLKMPKVDLKGPQMDVKGTRAKVTATEPEVSLPSVEVDIQLPGAKLEGDVVLADKHVAAKDSKFKIPKFKMPSFSMSAPGKATVEASLEVGAPKVEADVALHSVKGDLKTPDLSIQLPSADLELRPGQVDMKQPEGQPPEEEMPTQAVSGAGLKGHMPKVQMLSLKMPKVDLKGPHVDVKGARPKVTAPELEASLQGVEVDIQGPGATLEEDVVLADKEVGAKDSKFKMPKFKMPSFGVSAPGKPTAEASLDVGVPKGEGDVALPSMHGDLKAPDLSIQLPSAELELRASQVGVKLPEGQAPEAEVRVQAAAGAGLKGHLPKVQMPSLKMPKVDVKGPQVNVKGAKGEMSTPEAEVSLPGVEVDIQLPGAKLEGDVALADKHVAAKDSKFKIPKFKMPSFSMSAPGKPTVEASLDVGAPKVEGDFALPSLKRDQKTHDLNIQLPSAELEPRAGQVDMKLPEGQPPEAEMPAQAAAGASLKGHLPKVQMPSLKMPKVDVKGARGEMSTPDVEVSLPGMEVDIEAPGAKLEEDVVLDDKHEAAKDSKFKMPKFKMPSFGVSMPGKPTVEGSLDVGVPKVERDLALPSMQGDLKTPDLSIQLHSAELEPRAGQVDMKLPEGQAPEAEMPAQAAAGASLKGHLPKVQMPSLKMPKVDLKGPQVDVKDPKVDLKGAMVEGSAPDLEVSLPGVEVNIQASGSKLEGDVALGDQDMTAKDSKFKMPKFKMPSFGVSMPGKPTVEASLDVGAPKVERDLALPSVKGDLKTPDLSIQLSSAELEPRAGQVGVKLPEGQPPEAEMPAQAAARVDLKGHLHKVQMPCLEMPKVDLKGTYVDVKSPKLDVKATRAEVTSPELEVSLPSVEVDIQASGAKLEGQVALADKDMTAKDSKFKMPKFKMPSFGVSTPGKPNVEGSLDVGVPKGEGDETLPSMQGDLKTPDLNIQLPSAELELRAGHVDMKLPEGQAPEAEMPAQAAAGASIKGHLPKVQMPSLKMPKVDVKAPQVDVKGPKVDMKGVRGEMSAPEAKVSLPGVEVDREALGAKLEGDMMLDEKHVAAKDSKFKMPKFKMPSFGVSVPGKPTMEASLEVGTPKVEGDVALSSRKGDLETPDLSIQMPSADLELRTGQVGVKLPEGQPPEEEMPTQAATGAGLKGHLPKVQMPSLKMPKVDFKGPEVTVKDPKVDVKCARAKVSAPEVEVSLPKVEVDIKAPGAKMDADMAQEDKDMVTKDSKFKMPKFKMPSFGVSAPGKPNIEASLDVGPPKVEGDVALPSLQSDLKTPDLSIQLPSTELELRAGQVGVKLPEAQPPEAEMPAQAAAGVGLRGHFPKVQMPSLKIPKVDLKGPHMDVKDAQVDLKVASVEVSATDLEVSLPAMDVDIQAPGAKLDGEVVLSDKDIATKDSKFKMPKLKMPSFGVSVPGKPTMEASLEVGAPKVEADLALPSVKRDLKTPDLSIQLSSAELEPRAGQVGVKLPEGQPPEAEMPAQAAARVDLKGHLPKVQMPCLEMPKVDLKGTHVDVKSPKLDIKATRAEVTSPELEVSLPSVEVDIQASGAKLEGQVALADKDMTAKDSKFKMPKFKMPSFGVSVPGKPTMEASLELGTPKVEGDVALSSRKGDLETPDLSIQMPSADLELRTGQVVVKMSEGQLPKEEMPTQAATGAGLKGHLPKVQMPRLKTPKVDLKGPEVTVKGPKVDVKCARAKVSAPEAEVSLPRVEVDIKVPGAKMDADMAQEDKDMATKDSKFKMPKFKMPSFGVSAPGKPNIEASLDVGPPKVEGDVALPSLQSDLKTPDLSIQLPSTELELRAVQVGVKLPEAQPPEAEMPAQAAAGVGLRGHFPKVQMPSLKIPKVDLKGPHMDVKDAQVDLKVASVEVSATDLEVSLPAMDVDIQAPGAKLDGEVVLSDKDIATKDSKFKMPKLKMPSFGMSVPGKPTMEASLEVGAPKVEADLALPSVKRDLKTPDLGIQLPSTELELRASQVGVKLLEGQPPKAEMPAQSAAGDGQKGHLPKVQMPSLKMPKVDLKGPQVDVKDPKVDLKGAMVEGSAPDLEVSLPGVEVNIQASGSKLEGDVALADQDMTAKDSKFKMPKFKMPSFGVSMPGKPTVEASLDVGAPKVERDLALPSVKGDLKTSDLSIQLSSAELEPRAGHVDMKLPEGQAPEAEMPAQAAAGASIKGHLPKVQMPSLKMPKVDVKAPQVDVKGPKMDMKDARGEMSAPEAKVSLPGMEVDIEAPGAKLEGDMTLDEKHVAAKDSKFKMPKFKMPSFGVSVPGKPTMEASLEVGTPKVEGDVALSSRKGDLETPDVSIQMPSADLELRTGQVGVKMSEGQPPEEEMPTQAATGAGLKSHLPKVQIPSLKTPKVDLKGPEVAVKGPKVDVKCARAKVSAPEAEVSLPRVEVDIKAPGAKMDADMAQEDMDMATKDSKFKMPKFKMPSFGISAPGKPTMEASLDVGAPKVEGDVALPSLQGDQKTPDFSIQLPSADLELRAGQVDVKLSEGQPPEAEMPAQSASGDGQKGHLHKVQMPSLKMPKVDLKGPQVDVKDPKVDLKGAMVEGSAPDLEVSLPGVEVNIQASGSKLEGDVALADQDMTAKDSKFKMPKFKMPSFGVSMPGKPTVEASLDVGAPKVERDLALPSMKGDLKTPDLSIQLSSAELEPRAGQVGVKLPEGQPPEAEMPAQAAARVDLKGHLPKVQMPCLEMPKVDLKGTHVDVKSPKLDVKATRAEVTSPELEVSLPSVEVDIQASGAKLEGQVALADTDMTAKDSKFKMPKFKMPSFGVSTPGKPNVEGSLDVGVPKGEGDETLPSMQGDLKTPDLSIQLPSAELELRAGHVDMKLPEGQAPEAEMPAQAAAGASIKGHLPKVQMPSLKMPKVDVKAPQVDVKGPKMDMKDARGEMSAPEAKVSLPGMEVDIEAPGAKLEGDMTLDEKHVAAKDSKFKMPKFKMPSFGVSVPGKPTMEASLEVGTPKVEGDVALSSRKGDLETPDVSIQMPSADLELRTGQVGVKMSEGQPPEEEMPTQAATGAGLKGHLPKVQIPSLKTPKVDLKGPEVAVKGPKVDVKYARAKVSAPEAEVSLPRVEVDIKAPGAKMDADMAQEDMDMATKDSKFKMPKFKMPSFGVSAPGKPTMEASLDVGAPKVEGDVALPSLQGDQKTPDLSIQLPSADLELRAGQVDVKLSEGQPPEAEMPAQSASGDGQKGHLPKVQMPSLKMPKVDLKGPQVDVKDPKVDLKGAMVEGSAPDLEVSLPGVEVNIQASGSKLEGDVALADQDMTAKDSKFKMPKFKMPSFGVSMPGKPTVEASLDVGAPKVERDLALPSMKGDLKTPDLSIQLSSAELEPRAGQVGVKLPEGQPPEAEMPAQAAARVDLKGHLPKVQMPCLEMPKVDLKATHVDVKSPKLDVKATRAEVTSPEVLPSVEVDIQASGAKLEGQVALADKDTTAKDSKFKMPKLKMPSFGVSAPGKPTVEASLDVGAPKVEGDVALPSLQSDQKTPDLSIQLPSTELELRAGQVDMKLPEGQPPEEERPAEAAAGASLKGHLPKVQMPSLKMPKVDVKAPQVVVKGARPEVSAPELEVSLQGVEVDIQAPGATLEEDVLLAGKEVGAKDSKFKMPKIKLPSFSVSTPGKATMESSLEVGTPKVDGNVALPSMQGDLETRDLSIQLPSAELELRAGQVDMKLPEGQALEAEMLAQAAAGASLKGHLPKVQMPSLKMPKVDVKAPQVDVKGPKVDLKGVRGEVSASDLEVSLPGVEVDTEAPGAKLEGDVALDDKVVAAEDSKFKMPKFKMPSFGVSAPGKPTMEASLEVRAPKVEGDVALPSGKGDLETPDLSIQLPSADLELRTGQVGVKMSEGQPPEEEMPTQAAAGAGLKGHLPKVQMPRLKMPKVDLKGPEVTVKGPKVDVKCARAKVSAPEAEVSLSRVEVDIKAPGAKMDADMAQEDKDMAIKDSKFKMPKLKMPSFGVSVPGKPTVEASLDVGAPKVEGDVALPSLQSDQKTPDLNIQLPSADLELRAGQVDVKMLDGQPPEKEMPAQDAPGAGFKGHLPKVQMPSLKMPKVELKGPHVDVKGTKVDLKGAMVEGSAPDLEVSLPGVEVDIQASGAKLEGDVALADKDMAAKDSKFKIPKLKMPSFSVSVPGKPTMEASLEVGAPKMEADGALPSVKRDRKTPDLSIQLPSAELEPRAGQVGVKLPEGQPPEAEMPEQAAAGVDLKGHLPKAQMPSLKMPKVDLKGTHVDVKSPKVDVKGTRAEVTSPELEVSLPGVDVDIQTSSAKLEGYGVDKVVAAKDSKFKMPKFKMPSFGVSAPSKPTVEASLDVGVRKGEGDLVLPSEQGDLKTPDLSIQLPSAELELRAGQVGVKLLEGQPPEAEMPTQAAAGAGLKGHLPKVQMPSLKMPKVDLKGPHMDMKDAKVDLKGASVEVSASELEVSLPDMDVDIQAPGAKLEGEVVLTDKDIATKGSKFKMPKFKMPSFGVSVPGKPTIEASLEVGAPKVEADLALPSVKGDLKTPDLSIQLPSAELEPRASQVGVKLPEGQPSEAEMPAQAAAGIDLKGHLPKVQMPSLKMPKVDLKGIHVDVKSPKVDVKGTRAEVTSPELQVSLPSIEVDIQTSSAKLEGHVELSDKDMTAKDSKFKMPKFKIPSFGISVPGKPTVEASLDVGVPKGEGDLALPSDQGDLKTPDLSIQLPSAELEPRAGQVGVKLLEGQPPEAEMPTQSAAGAGLKGHLPKVQMPSFKVSKVDLKGPHVDMKGPKVDVKGARPEVSAPELEVSLPGVEVDIQAPGAKLEGHVGLADKDMASKDSKFKMPKFKMPSFGVSVPGKPTMEASLEVGVPKVEGDVTLHSVQGDLMTPDLGIQLPSAELELRASQVDVKLPECQPSESEMPAQAAAGASLKVHLPEVQMPSLKMPKVDLKGPPVDFKRPKEDVTGGNVEVGFSRRKGYCHYPDDDVSQAIATSPSDVFPSAVLPSPPASQSFYSYVGRSSFMVDPPLGSLDSTFPQFSARILFPKFHKPKFVLSVTPSGSECPLSVPDAVVSSHAASDTLSCSVAPQVLSSDASEFSVLDVSSQSLISPPPEASTLETKDTSFKLPSIKLPSLHWSPKKASVSKDDSDSQESPMPTLGLTSVETDSEIQSKVSVVESPQHASLDKEVEKGRSRKLSFSMPRLGLPKIKVSKGSAAVPQEDLRPSLTGTTSDGDLDVTETAVTDAHVGDTHSKGGVTTELHVRSSSTTAELPRSQTELPPPKHDLNVRGDSKSLMIVSPSQPFGELTTPRTEGPLQPSSRQGDSAPTMGDLEVDPTAKDMSTDSNERRFRIPKFRVPGFRRSSSKDRDQAGEQEAPQKSQTPVIDMPSEAEETAAACVQLSHVPESKIETHISLGSPEEGAGVRPLERPTYADVVKHDLHGAGSRVHRSTVELSRTHLPTPEFGSHSSQGSVSLEVPGVRVSEPQLPPEGTGKEQHPGPGGNILAETEARTGRLASQPQGPLRLKASLTDVPAQVSVVSMSQLWEDSVLTVTFPKLKVPRFSFPSPSSEADVFFPVVREVEASVDSTIHKGSPGLWEASILKTGVEDTRVPPASLEQSLEASPISKVRVHIQGSRGESQEVAISSRVEESSADPLAPGPFCTRIVRESEIPASTVQTPSYGFSLLKVKIPESPMQACVYTVGPDSQVQEGGGGAPMPAAAGGHSIPAEVPPDTGEPFEIISSSAGMLPGPQLADSTSDEEPAEILEFPEDSQEVKAPDTDTKQKAEGKKASLLWSWLPSIGFSSVEEMAADSRDTTQRSPVHVQPTARLDPELPRKQEKAGWFRFPKLGFSSSPTKKPRGTEDAEDQAEHKLQEETVTFFDARESFSPEEEEEAKSEVTSAGPGSETMVTSSARTELVLLEQTRDTGDKSIPRPVAK